MTKLRAFLRLLFSTPVYSTGCRTCGEPVNPGEDECTDCLADQAM